MIKELFKREKTLDQEIIDQIVTNLFLRKVINPKSKINYYEFVSQAIEQSIESDNKRKIYLENIDDIHKGQKSLGVGIV